MNEILDSSPFAVAAVAVIAKKLDDRFGRRQHLVGCNITDRLGQDWKVFWLPCVMPMPPPTRTLKPKMRPSATSASKMRPSATSARKPRSWEKMSTELSSGRASAVLNLRGK